MTYIGFKRKGERGGRWGRGGAILGNYSCQEYRIFDIEFSAFRVYQRRLSDMPIQYAQSHWVSVEDRGSRLALRNTWVLLERVQDDLCFS